MLDSLAPCVTPRSESQASANDQTSFLYKAWVIHMARSSLQPAALPPTDPQVTSSYARRAEGSLTWVSYDPRGGVGCRPCGRTFSTSHRATRPLGHVWKATEDVCHFLCWLSYSCLKTGWGGAKRHPLPSKLCQ